MLTRSKDFSSTGLLGSQHHPSDLLLVEAEQRGELGEEVLAGDLGRHLTPEQPRALVPAPWIEYPVGSGEHVVVRDEPYIYGSEAEHEVHPHVPKQDRRFDPR